MSERYNVYKSNISDEYIIGEFIMTSTEDEIFEVLMKINLREHKRVQSIFNLSKKVYNVDGVFTKESKEVIV